MSLAHQVEQISSGISSGFNSVDFEVLSSLKKFSEALQANGVYKPLLSEKSVQQLPKLSNSHKQHTIAYLNLWTQFITPRPQGNLDIVQPLNNEHLYLKRFLEHCQLEIDERFWTSLTEDTVVEVYDENMVQLYRSYSLLDKTGYSLLDLCTFEWFVLWERPKMIIEQMNNGIKNIFENEMKFKTFDVSKHVLRETFETGLTQPFAPRACVVEFKHIGFLKQLSPSSPRAFICTARGSVISEGTEVSKLDFI